MPTTTQYLDPRVLASLGTLELRARMIVEGVMTGMHRSPYQGFSVEFAQHRPYAPGDDLRHLDWKVYARTDKLYLKQYQQETNLDLLLLIDSSGSMAYSSEGAGSGAGKGAKAKSNTWRKYDHAASLAAALAYMGLAQQDRVGLVIFDDKVQQVVRASNAKDHWRTLVEALSSQSLLEQESGNATDLARLFDQVCAQFPQRSLVVLISDLFDEPVALERGLARLHHRRHDAIVLQTLDPAERGFPFRSPSEFVGLESEGRLSINPAALRDGYMKIMKEHQRQVQQACRRFQFDYAMLDTAEHLGAPLSKVLARREAVIKHGKST